MSKISGMPVANALTGNELIETVQDGENKRVLVSDLFSASNISKGLGFTPADATAMGDVNTALAAILGV